jgi:hypothetical protein
MTTPLTHPVRFAHPRGYFSGDNMNKLLIAFAIGCMLITPISMADKVPVNKSKNIKPAACSSYYCVVIFGSKRCFCKP